MVLLTLLGTSGGYWSESPPANLPANVTLSSSKPDKKVPQYEVVVGDQIMEAGEWNSGKDYLMKPKVEVHTFVRQDLSLSGGNITGQDFGNLKKGEYAMIENIRDILRRHSDRPTSDCMFVFYDPAIVDRDNITSRQIQFHKIIRCSCWFVSTYT